MFTSKRPVKLPQNAVHFKITLNWTWRQVKWHHDRTPATLGINVNWIILSFVPARVPRRRIRSKEKSQKVKCFCCYFRIDLFLAIVQWNRRFSTRLFFAGKFQKCNEKIDSTCSPVHVKLSRAYWADSERSIEKFWSITGCWTRCAARAGWGKADWISGTRLFAFLSCTLCCCRLLIEFHAN